MSNNKSNADYVWTLKGINIEMMLGEILDIIGKNRAITDYIINGVNGILRRMKNEKVLTQVIENIANKEIIFNPKQLENPFLIISVYLPLRRTW